MTATQPPLFAPGWEQEPCGDADERAFLDLHGPQTRRDVQCGRDTETVTVRGGVL